MWSTFNNYYSGTSGLLLPVPNKDFYPEEFREKSRLCYYASLMNSIEINSSFYKIPMASTIQRWAAEVPESFRFTFKMAKDVTHNKDLTFNHILLSKFFSVVSNVGDKKGCLLVQFPPSVRLKYFAQLKLLMSALRDNDPFSTWKIALEFRHVSLYCEEIYELLEEFGLSMVIHDKTPAASPLRDSVLDFVYLRFHGPGGNYRGSYSDDMLYEYGNYILELLEEGKEVFVYFNNTMGEAYGNLKTIKKIVSKNS